jgi:hypothetical protein
MSTFPAERTEPVWGAPRAAPPRWGLRQTAAAVGVAAVIAGVGGAAIYAAADGGSHALGGGGPHQPFGPGHPPGGPGGPPPGMFGPGPDAVGETSVHGEYVVADGHGGYRTVLTQTGRITELSATSITVRSDDGYVQTYVMPPSAGAANAPFAVDDQVIIRASRDGQQATVTSIG